MKRIISFILIIVMSVVFFAGCKEKKNPDGLVNNISPTDDVKTAEPSVPQPTDNPTDNIETATPTAEENIDKSLSLEVSDKVQMSLNYIDAENCKLRFTISNSTTQTYAYGHDFILEKYENGVWSVVPFKESAAVTEEAILLFSDEEHSECYISFPEYYDHLSVGSYRLTKNIYGYGNIFMAFDLDSEMDF